MAYVFSEDQTGYDNCGDNSREGKTTADCGEDWPEAVL